MHGGGAVVLVVLALVCAGSLIGVGRRALAAHRGQQGRSRRSGGGLIGGWLSDRRARRLERIRHESASARDEAKHKHRLAEQEAAAQARANGDAGGARPRGGTVRSKVVRLGDEPAPDAKPGSREAGPSAGDGGGAPASSGPAKPSGPPVSPQPPAAPAQSASPAPGAPPQQPPARNGAAPAATTPVPGPSPSPTLEGVVVTNLPDTPGTLAVPGVEMIIEGANALRRYMLAGNARAKLRGVAGIEAAGDCLAGTVRALAREMAEPGQHYGPEVTEPLAMSAVHYGAAGLGLSEVEGRLRAAVRAAEEFAASGVQPPHHDQLADR
jgi:hypothetical protein